MESGLIVGLGAKCVGVRLLRRAILALSLVPAWALGAQGAGSVPHGADQAPPRGSTMVVSLISIGQGDEIWERFGHNALRFRDTTTGADVVYNWGLFSFSEKGFILRFLKGTGRYSMGGQRTDSFLAMYASEDRHAWEQQLNLSTEQKALAMDLVVENEKPENREYLYNYYLDNCSTRIRDLLNRVLDGQVHAATDTAITSNSYRSHTRRLLTDNKLPYFGVQLVLGRPADLPISRWDEMFLPVHMMRHFADVKVRGKDGQMLPLVASVREISRPVRRAPELERVAPKTAGYLLVGLVLALAMAVFARSGALGSQTGRTMFTGISLLWSALAGAVGTLALGMWLFTHHTFMHYNETILLLNPLHLALAVLLPGAVLRTKRVRGATTLVRAIVALSLIGLVAHVVPGLGQANPEILALAIPANLALLAGVMQIRKHN